MPDNMLKHIVKGTSSLTADQRSEFGSQFHIVPDRGSPSFDSLIHATAKSVYIRSKARPRSKLSNVITCMREEKMRKVIPVSLFQAPGSNKIQWYTI